MNKKHIKDKKLSKVVGGQQTFFDNGPFHNNEAKGDGGAIHSENRSVTIIE